MELSASNTEKGNTREGKWYRFMHPIQNPFFSRNLSNVLTALLHFKGLSVANLEEKQNELVTGSLAVQMYHLLGHILRIKTAYDTYICADMKV